jgi:hypothetical protein
MDNERFSYAASSTPWRNQYFGIAAITKRARHRRSTIVPTRWR